MAVAFRRRGWYSTTISCNCRLLRPSRRYGLNSGVFAGQGLLGSVPVSSRAALKREQTLAALRALLAMLAELDQAIAVHLLQARPGAGKIGEQINPEARPKSVEVQLKITQQAL